MNVLFVDELNILGSSIIPAEYLYMVSLDGAAFLNDTLVGVGERFREEAFPLAVRKGVVVQKRELLPEIGNQPVFVMDGKVLISLCGQQADEFFFQSRFALKAVRASAFRCIFSYNGAFVGFCDDIEIAHIFLRLFNITS